MTPLLAQRPRVDRAFERLYKQHVHAVYRYALAVLHNEADAEDVTQNTFLSAYRAYTRGERPERPHNWLIKIAHNVCRQRFRDSARRPQEVAFEESLAASVPPADDDVPTAAEIRRALGFLGFNQRAALVMRELEGRSYAEIAQILDVSVGAVETLIFRARRALREQLEGGLTCQEAELTLSRLQEERLSNDERGALRAHLRECKDCAMLERRQRAQRAAIKGLATMPLPPSLTTFFGGGAVGGGAALGMGIGTKVAAVVAAGLVAGGLGHEALRAVGADKPSHAAQPGLQQASFFTPLAAIMSGRAARPFIAALVTKPFAKGGTAAHRSKTMADEGSGETAAGAPAGHTGQHTRGVRNTVEGLVPQPPVSLPPIQVPQVPVAPVQLPVQLPTVPHLPIPPPPPLPPLP